jgi:hypothetical protein
MIVRIKSHLKDASARRMYERFRADGYCPFAHEDFLMGFLRDAREDATGFILTVEVTNPQAISYIRSLGNEDS